MNTNHDELQAAGGESPVDFEQLRAASGEDADLMRDLIKLYFDQAAEVMAGLHEAVQQRSAQDVDYLSHKLVGASLACGMTAMVVPLREMEARGRKGDLTGVEGFLAQVVTQLEVVRACVEEFQRTSQN